MFQFGKRIVLFALTNVLILITISVVLSVLGVQPYLSRAGIDYNALVVFCLVWGMGGAFISLLMSRFMAKMMMGIKLIGPDSGGEYGALYSMVAQIAKAANLPNTPEVGIYESPEVNAFATGPTKGMALVAFSTGILRRMNRDELEGVIAHELSHVRNGDMVTMTLLQGIINAFVMFLARVIGFVLTQSRDGENRGMTSYLVVMVLEILLSILGSIVVLWFSRQREFKADKGSAQLVGQGKMVAALKNLMSHQELAQVGEAHGSLATMKIAGAPSWARLFMSHPPLEERIQALQSYK